jgi:hypothetical protein
MFGLITPIVTLLDDVLKRVLPEKMSEADRLKIQAELQSELLKADWQAIQAQLQVNAEEAKHESIFIAGWRPGIGWVCGAALAWNYVVGPLLAFVLQAFGLAVPLPVLDASTLMPVLLGLLGLGGLRTYEKVSGGANLRR